jgi:chromosome segregation ATPase
MEQEQRSLDAVAALALAADRRLELVQATCQASADQVKEYVEKILAEKDRALEMASSEREKAASALRGEQTRAQDQASRERDKAAENLRVELARSINEGDERLREHVANQVKQIEAALKAAQREADKFEDTVVARFEQVNEFRLSLDDLSKQMATRRELEQAMATNNGRYEEIVKTLGEFRSRLDTGPEGLQSLQSRLDRYGGRHDGLSTSGRIVSGVVAVVGVIVTIVVLAANGFIGQSTPTTPAPTTPTPTVTVTVP